MTGTIRLNGRPEALVDATVAALLDRLGITASTKGAAVALNGGVVPRARWAETALTPGDEIEVIRAMAGG